MASKPCMVCLGFLRLNSWPIVQRCGATMSIKQSRTFMTTTPFYTKPSNVEDNTPLSVKAAAGLKKVAGRATQSYTAFGVTEQLYKECSKQADYTIPQAAKRDAEMPKTEEGEDLGVGEGWWHTGLGLKPTFSTWSQVTMLHMYLITVRFRCFPRNQSPTWQQHLLDHFFYDAERRMEINHNMHSRGTRQKYLKDLFIQWRGLLVAYDEGLVKGDAVLAAAIWRNIFKANENVNVKSLALIVSYMRRALRGLDSVSDSSLASGLIGFGSPAAELDFVELRSKRIDIKLKDSGAVDESSTG